MSDEGSGSFGIITELQSALFRPYPPSIFVDTNALLQDAEQSGVNELSLLEILVHHELVHMWMMSRFVNNPDSDWIKSTDIRFIHESVALRACESSFSALYKTATIDDTKLYLAYVASQAQQVQSGLYYKPYFEKFRGVTLHEFWSRLMADSPIPLHFP